jgi:uroporphyrinogen decarboxylase
MNESMTSRERVIRTLNREPVDRMPIDLGSHFSTGISAFAYWNLRERLGLSTDAIEVIDTMQFLARVDEDVLERFHCDLIALQPRWVEPRRWRPRDEYEFIVPRDMSPRLDEKGAWVMEKARPDGTLARRTMPRGGFFFDGDWVGSKDWSDADEAARLAGYAREAERIFKETPYACNYIGFGAFFGGIAQSLRMLEDPDGVLEQNRRQLDRYIAHFADVNEAMGEHIQLITVGNDMGMQRGPICDPALIDEFCGPFYKRFCDFVHEHSDIKVFMHNCGSIKPLIPCFIEWGIDALNPVQISADNMAPRELKAEYGDRIVFWGGGCDTQRVLGTGSPDDVAANVRELVGVFKPGGGFVFNQVHNVLGNVPPENVIAMLDTAFGESSF